MFEYSIATGLVEGVLEFAEAHPEDTVLNVCLQLGEWAFIDPNHLKSCYRSIVRGSRIDGSGLEVELLPAIVRCPHCSYEGSPKYSDGALASQPLPTQRCPQCGSAAHAIQGHECLIRAIEFEPHIHSGPNLNWDARHPSKSSVADTAEGWEPGRC